MPKKAKSQNEKSKECMRKLREKIKNDPVLYEEEKRKARERYRARKEAGKVKSINDLSEREKRKIRKGWKERSKRSYYLKKSRERMERQAQEYTPPSTPPHVDSVSENEPGPSRQSIVGRRTIRKNRNILKKEISSLKEKLQRAERRNEKYRKKLQRIKKGSPNSPNKRVNKILKDQQVTPEVKKQLLIGEVLKDQLKVNFKEQKKLQEKRRFVKNISGNITKKYRIKNVISNVTSRHLVQKKSPTLSNKRKQMVMEITKKVSDFFLQDEISRMCPGK